MEISMINAYRGISYPVSMYTPGSPEQDVNAAIPGVQSSEKDTDAGKVEKNPGESEIKAPGRKSSPAECETCKERKYQDGSDEMVSFKSASHISPTAAPSAVRAHEGEHVSNAYKKAAEKGGKVLRASVTIKMAICPECGRSYVAGGQTDTCIKFPKDDNPYNKNLRSYMDDATKGGNISAAV
ncbi:MAG: hypothetical protein J5829_05180 [Lachnospiraceae bacterium]|nr:hypothetical protein [Lachnospiraceae bacterium]